MLIISLGSSPVGILKSQVLSCLSLLLAALLIVLTPRAAFSATTIEAVPRSADCDRTCLRGLTDDYLRAMLAHNPAGGHLAADARYTENAVEVKIGDGLWKTASQLRAAQEYFQDPVSGNALFRGVVEEAGTDSPAIVAIHLRTAERKITGVEAIVVRKNGHGTYTPDALTTVNPLLTSVVPPAERSPRAAMVAIADSYWNGIERRDSAIVLAAPGCGHLLNGKQVTNQTGEHALALVKADCAGTAALMTQVKAIPERRYTLIDEERGIVIGTFLMDVPPGPSQVDPSGSPGRTSLTCEVFKIVGGKFLLIEGTLTIITPYGTSSTGW